MTPEHDPLDIAARIDELKLLTDGWLDGKGRAPDPGGLDWARKLLETHLPDHVQLPYLYPTPDGAIQAEWSVGGTDISLETGESPVCTARPTLLSDVSPERDAAGGAEAGAVVVYSSRRESI